MSDTSIINRAIWFVEAQLAHRLTLERVATFVGVSQGHLSRIFARATGFTVMRYVQARRLSLAADLLTGTTVPVQDVAVSAGYASHEAFCRAFRRRFGCTPMDARRGLSIVACVPPASRGLLSLSAPVAEIRTLGPWVVAGLERTYEKSADHYPNQWHDFQQQGWNPPLRVDRTFFGIRQPDTRGLQHSYLCGIRLRRESDAPPGWCVAPLPRRTYAVFTHNGHVADIPSTWLSIWTCWSPPDGYRIDRSAPTIECYDETFVAYAGTRGVEIWIPISR